MRRLALAVALLVSVLPNAAIAKNKSRTPVTAEIKNLEASPQELRIRVRALVRPTLGIIEESADQILRSTSDPVARRAVLVWKIEATTTILSAMLRTDPVLALADAWGYVFQIQDLLALPEMQAKYGDLLPRAPEALAHIDKQFREFVTELLSEAAAESFASRVRVWAERHPIEGALYRRPSMDSAVAATLATSSGGGGMFSALGNLDESMADVMARIDLYTMYVPRLARWEAELAADDMLRGVDAQALAAEFERLTRAVDRLAVVAESASDIVARERGAALDGVRAEREAVVADLRAERRAVLEALQQERIAALAEVEAIAQRLADRSGGPLHAAVQTELDDLVVGVEEMRKRLMVDAGMTLNDVVDHAFVRAIQLLLVSAVLVALVLVVYVYVLRGRIAGP